MNGNDVQGLRQGDHRVVGMYSMTQACAATGHSDIHIVLIIRVVLYPLC